jgi:hypothetical protein
MRKREEREKTQSCFNRSQENELMFVLLGRDPAAPLAIRAWVEARILIGKNKFDDPQITEALTCAGQMEMEREIKTT